ncbi:unnamed protein product, partial [Prorocentrum cordatum]
MEKIGNTWDTTATATSGPLPGPRQSNNRAKITAFLDCLQTTEGNLMFYTDSEILCEGEAEMRVRHIESHMTKEQATERGVRIEAWKGNEKADELAGEAAASHEISEAQMGCYRWVLTTSHLVRTRIGRASRYALEALRKKKDWSVGAGTRWNKSSKAKFARMECSALDHASSQNVSRSEASGLLAHRGLPKWPGGPSAPLLGVGAEPPGPASVFDRSDGLGGAACSPAANLEGFVASFAVQGANETEGDDSQVKYTETHVVEHKESTEDSQVKFTEVHVVKHQRSKDDSQVTFTDTHVVEHQGSETIARGDCVEVSREIPEVLYGCGMQGMKSVVFACTLAVVGASAVTPVQE